jgi:hypothetical protein
MGTICWTSTSYRPEACGDAQLASLFKFVSTDSSIRFPVRSKNSLITMPNDDDARLIIPMTGRDPPDLNNLARLMQRGPLSEADHGES